MITRMSSRCLTTTLLAMACGSGASSAAADSEIPFDVHDVYAELNHTDGDLGFHALIDGEAWRMLAIEAPNGRELLGLVLKSRLRSQGLTELFFESAEPTFDELSADEFFRRFPAGEYEIEGLTLEREELESVDMFSHVMPAPPGNVRVSGEASAENCDADPLPSVADPVTIAFDPVLTSHPEVGEPGIMVEIARYEVVVEREEPSPLVFRVDLPPDVAGITVPADFIALGDAFKFEILAIAADGNRTAVESCFEVE